MKKIERSGKKYITASFILTFLQITLLFLAAGEVNIIRFWIFGAVQIIYIIFSFILLYFKNSGLLNERGKKKTDSQKWDNKLLIFINICLIFILPVIIGFDHRHECGILDHLYLIPGFILYTISNILVLSSMVVNKHFETNVRHQKDRHHKIITVGPYSIVRHPGYSGTILWLTGVPLILGSLLGLLFSVFIIILFVYRTHKEDHFLKNNLSGYKTYMNNVKFRLIPYIW